MHCAIYATQFTQYTQHTANHKDMTPNNPFLISGYHSPRYFCDRNKETQTIIDALYNGRNVTLVAPRRMGKTGLIHHVFYQLKQQQPEIVTLYMDIYSTQSIGDFVRLLANTVLGKLDTAPQKALSRISKFIRSCRPTLTVDEMTGMPKVTIDIAPAQEESTLREIFQYLGSSEKRCYIAIDEFQQITEYPEKGIEALLRSYIQFLPNISFIFSGSRQHVIQEMFASSKRPFYQSTQLLTLSTINKEEYAQFAIQFFEQRGLTLPREIFDSVYDKFEGHTWYIQSILNRLYGYGRDADQQLLTYAIQEIISEMSYSYADLLRSYSNGQRQLLRAIAKEGCVKEILSGDFISRHNLRATSSVRTALNKLIANELAYPTNEGYIIYDRFMGEWLRSQPY